MLGVNLIDKLKFKNMKGAENAGQSKAYAVMPFIELPRNRTGECNMKEFIEKLIGRLEEEKNVANNTYMNYELNVDLGRVFGLDKAIEIVNQLAEEYKGGWIPCSDRLPIGEEYHKRIDGVDYYKHMLTFANDIDAPICVGWYDQEDEQWYDIEGFAYFPKAWQPLPAPYQPKGE